MFTLTVVSCRKQLGGKLGSSLQSDLGVKAVGDLLQFPVEKLQERYGTNTGWDSCSGLYNFLSGLPCIWL